MASCSFDWRLREAESELHLSGRLFRWLYRKKDKRWLASSLGLWLVALYLLGHDLDGELAILLDLILQRHDQASYELLSVVELDELVSDGRGANHFVELH